MSLSFNNNQIEDLKKCIIDFYAVEAEIGERRIPGISHYANGDPGYPDEYEDEFLKHGKIECYNGEKIFLTIELDDIPEEDEIFWNDYDRNTRTGSYDFAEEVDALESIFDELSIGDIFKNYKTNTIDTNYFTELGKLSQAAKSGYTWEKYFNERFKKEFPNYNSGKYIFTWEYKNLPPIEWFAQ